MVATGIDRDVVNGCMYSAVLSVLSVVDVLRGIVSVICKAVFTP